MATGYHAVEAAGIEPGRHGRGARPRAGRPVRGAGREGGRRGGVIAIDTVPERLEMARSFGATPVHLTEEDPRAAVKQAHRRARRGRLRRRRRPSRALELAARLTRKRAARSPVIGVYAERTDVHMGVVWIKALTLVTGQANVIGHVDRVLGMMSAGVLDPTPLVTRHMTLDDAEEAYEAYDRREALKIVLSP